MYRLKNSYFVELRYFSNSYVVILIFARQAEDVLVLSEITSDKLFAVLDPPS